MRIIIIDWTLCKTYDDAKHFRKAIYLHEWSANPFYWGMLDETEFGGNRQKTENGYLNPRYGSSYKHWIEGCLHHGAILYIGTPKKENDPNTADNEDGLKIEMIECQLIHDYPSKMNGPEKSRNLTFEHLGDVPLSIRTK